MDAVSFIFEYFRKIFMRFLLFSQIFCNFVAAIEVVFVVKKASQKLK